MSGDPTPQPATTYHMHNMYKHAHTPALPFLLL